MRQHLCPDIDGGEPRIFNVVYLCYPSHKTKLGKYLLQYKYSLKSITANGEPLSTDIQVCEDISRKRCECLSEAVNEAVNSDSRHSCCPGQVDIACIWFYDPILDRTKFSMILNNNVRHLKETFNQVFGCDINKGLVYPGLHKIIPGIPPITQ